MAIPTEKERMTWTGGDATKEKVAGIDWNGKVFLADDVEGYYRLLKERVPDASEEIIIAIAELLCLMVLATARGHAWANRIVLYVSDNQKHFRCQP